MCHVQPSGRGSWKSPTVGVYPKPCRYSRLSLRIPGEAVAQCGLLASLAPRFPAGCPAALAFAASPIHLRFLAEVSREEGPCFWLSTGWGRWRVLPSGVIPSGVQLPSCALVRGPQARTRHPWCVAAPPFLGGVRGSSFKGHGKISPPAFQSEREHGVILGFCADYGDS